MAAGAWIRVTIWFERGASERMTLTFLPCANAYSSPYGTRSDTIKAIPALAFVSSVILIVSFSKPKWQTIVTCLCSYKRQIQPRHVLLRVARVLRDFLRCSGHCSSARIVLSAKIAPEIVLSANALALSAIFQV